MANSHGRTAEQIKRSDGKQRSRQLNKQGHGRYIWSSAKGVDQELDSVIAELTETQVDALKRCWRDKQSRIHIDTISIPDLTRLRKVFYLRRWTDPETEERSKDWYELAPQGTRAVKRILERERS